MVIAERLAEFGRAMVTPRISILIVRLAMGVLSLKAGLDKIIDGEWTATGGCSTRRKDPSPGS